MQSSTPAGWVVAFSDTKEKTIYLVEEGDDAPIEDHIELHVVPFRRDGDLMVFGSHEFTSQCICRPRVECTERGQKIIIHEDRKPN